ncbi:unnamed protein product [Kluyveromyces dobzhanskii CBS 2104]|uniref:WGS project CCBQ000000000 data, contig 00015 n=1 Tax=Kluyveromyces dobzhanskii CBS 2104 TaxID=1427455 RepID=A0A0A8LAJ4_9SACH|nr:unnamed protein product [Kluyveromyces dobzhanskii CBS 2104]
MREANYRSVTGNRATVSISQTVYDRRALDNVSDLPLINSLNHLAFLCSTSTLIREVMSRDGALERLVSILHECYIPLTSLPQVITPSSQGTFNPLQIVKRDRQLAYASWKWTLAYQCLVLTGTRGTLGIREQVVKSGIIPIIATVLDNYMIYYKNFDFINNTAIPFTFTELADLDSCLFQFTDEELKNLNEKLDPKDPYYKDFISMERLKLLLGKSEYQFEFDVENVAGLHLKPNFVTELDTDWQSLAQEELRVPLPGSALENVMIMPPRRFFLGKVIPELDDVTWAVQLLAFLTKNTAVKPILQNTNLVDTLSFRPILENAKVRMSKNLELDMTPLSLHVDGEEGEDEEDEDEEDEADEPPEDKMDLSPDVTLIEKYFKEIEHLCLAKDSTEDEEEYHSPVDILDFRLRKEESLQEKFKEYCRQHEFSKELTNDDWVKIFNSDAMNLFALVERFTVKGSLNEIVHYWSSVVMRNSCRKHEATGVRQCANFSCGKWEDHPKQFPKCRRCKRTKYCSRLCQLKSWEFHRYWCQESNTTTTTENNTGVQTPLRDSSEADLNPEHGHHQQTLAETTRIPPTTPSTTDLGDGISPTASAEPYIPLANGDTNRTETT